MSSTLLLNIPQVQAGLPTYTYTVPAVSTQYPFGGAGLYNVIVNAFVQNAIIGNGAGAGVAITAPTVTSSGVSYVVNQNGSPVFTSATITPSQTALESKTELICAVSDVITVVFTSSNAIDKQLNSVQSIVAIEQGI